VDAVAGIRWYHTIELPGGVITPGVYDHRSLAQHLPLPRSLVGQRCLDVGTANGFWAFEMERRGAAEVVAIDLDDPAQRDWQGGTATPAPALQQVLPPTAAGFRVARDALGSQVDRRNLSVYDLSPGLVGQFDFVFAGSVLLHVRDPVGALASIRRVLRGEVLCLEAISLPLTLLLPRIPAATLWPFDESQWWIPNRMGLKRMVQAAGLRVSDAGGPCFQKFGPGNLRPARGRRPTPAWAELWLSIRQKLLTPLGTPSAWVLACQR